MRVTFLITLSQCLKTALYNTAVTGSKNLKPPISFPVTTFYSFEKQNWIDDCQVVTDLPWRRNHELIYPGISLYKEVFFQKKKAIVFVISFTRVRRVVDDYALFLTENID